VAGLDAGLELADLVSYRAGQGAVVLDSDRCSASEFVHIGALELRELALEGSHSPPEVRHLFGIDDRRGWDSGMPFCPVPGGLELGIVPDIPRPGKHRLLKKVAGDSEPMTAGRNPRDVAVVA